jgi:hypothetical protein
MAAPSGTDRRPDRRVGRNLGARHGAAILDRYRRAWTTTKSSPSSGISRATMTIDPGAVRTALDAATRRAFQGQLPRLHGRPPTGRQELIRRLNQVPGATGAGGDARRPAAAGARRSRAEALDLDFRHLFASWFNRGFLVLRPISWESPAHILEKIIAYEAVHAIDSWDDLRRRLEPADRRCFAFFHPAMPDEPLIFVEVALTKGIPGSVQALLAEDRAAMPARGRHGGVLLDLELPGGPGQHLLRQFADQAGGGGSVDRACPG